MLDSPKCLECSKYNKDDLISFSCEEYKKIPNKYIESKEKCEKFKKDN